MTEFWNPYTTQGENPFPQFPTWAEFITHYAVPENVINREEGPGDAIGEGEWYLSGCEPLGDARPLWYLSYVGTGGNQARFIEIIDGRPSPFYQPPLQEPTAVFTRWEKSPFLGGYKNGWGSRCIRHYKVDIADVKRFTLINWTEDPFEEVKG